MADVKISGLSAASSANPAMQLEVNDGGTSKRATVAQINNPAWTQIGSTQNASGNNTITFSSIPAYDEIYIEVSGVAITTNGSAAGYFIGIEWSANSGTNYYGLIDSAGAPITSAFEALYVYKNSGNSPALLEASIRRPSPSIWELRTFGANSTSKFGGFGSASDESYATFILATPSAMTNLRLKSYWYDGPGALTASNMTAGTIKLFGR